MKAYKRILHLLLLVFIFIQSPNFVFADSPDFLLWTYKSDMPTARYGLAAAADGNNIYAIGGLSYLTGVPSLDLLNTVEMYDSLNDSWSSVEPMPTIRAWLGSVKGNDGKIYAIGGQGGPNNNPLNTVEVYDPASNTWETKSSMNEPRTSFGLVKASNGKIYALGGISYYFDGTTNQYPIVSSIEEYDPVTDVWTTKTNMPQPKYDIQVVASTDNKIYVFNGTTGNNQYDIDKETYIYDISSDSWSTGASIPFLQYGRSSVSGANGSFYLIGGSNPIRPLLSTVQAYDPTLDIWTYGQNEGFTISNMQIARNSLATVITQNGYIYAIGGLKYDFSNWPNLIATGTVEQATIQHTPTVTPTPTEIPTPTPTGIPTPTMIPSPVTVTYFSSADTYIKNGADNRNYGAGIFMRLRHSGDNRSLVRFDQSAIQNEIGNKQVLAAKLRVTIVDNGNNWGTLGRTIDVHRLLLNWTEGNGTENNRGAGLGAIWECATDSNIANQSKNCTGSNEWEMGQPNNPSVHPWVQTATAAQTITNNQTGVVEFDVTSDVVSFLNGTNQNYGWIIKKTAEGQNGQVSFGTKESSSVPQLVVTYQP